VNLHGRLIRKSPHTVADRLPSFKIDRALCPPLSNSPSNALADPRPDPSFAQRSSIADSFGAAAGTYDQYALVQAQCARRLVALLQQDFIDSLPPAPILEVGCGTGFLSEQLLESYGDRHRLYFTDLAPEMVQVCQQRLSGSRFATLGPGGSAPTFQVREMDGADLGSGQAAGNLGLIASSFALQWFENPGDILAQWLDCLVPGGWLAIAFPTCHSFRQLQACCTELELPYPIMAMPDPRPLIDRGWHEASECIFQQEFVSLQAPNAQAFLRHFHRIGAVPRAAASEAVSEAKPQPLSTAQLRQLIRYWNRISNCPAQDINVDYYHVTYLFLQR